MNSRYVVDQDLVKGVANTINQLIDKFPHEVREAGIERYDEYGLWLKFIWICPDTHRRIYSKALLQAELDDIIKVILKDKKEIYHVQV